MRKVLIIRFTALGDVAMSIPIVYSLAEAYPHIRFTMLTHVVASSLFINTPKNLTVFAVDTKGKYKGIKGLLRLFKELHKHQFDAVADLHNVIRSITLRLLFALTGAKVATIDKGRKDKRQLTTSNNQYRHQLKTSFERYIEVFNSLGLPFTPSFISIFGDNKKGDPKLFSDITTIDNSLPCLGIAPFAKHIGKIYPLPLMEQVIAQLAATGKYRLFLFGGGQQEEKTLESWQNHYPNTLSVVGKHGFKKELALISHLSLMVTMDSANMHLSSLCNIPVISIWGATHPYAGFMGWHQNYKNVISLPLVCRPCSVFGNKTCRYKTYACLNQITPNTIITQIEKVLADTKSV